MVPEAWEQPAGSRGAGRGSHTDVPDGGTAQSWWDGAEHSTQHGCQRTVLQPPLVM